MSSKDINNKYCRVYMSQHYEGWEERTFENYDLQNYLETLDSVGSDVVIVTARTHNGYWFTDLGIGQMHPGLKGIDELQEAISYFHKRGKLVVAYFSTVYDKKTAEMHPEWAETDYDGTPFGGGVARIVCMNSPYREYCLHMLRTLCEKRDLDGILVDMPFWEKKVCYCKSCRNAFRIKYNKEIPALQNFNDAEMKHYMQERYDSNVAFVKEIVDCVHEVKPDMLCYPQCDILKVGSRNSHGMEVASYGDYIYSDLYFQFGTIQLSAVTRLMSKLSKNIPEIGIMTRPGTHDDAPNMMPMDQLRNQVFTIVANGGGVHLFDIMMPDGSVQKDMWKRQGQAFSEIRERQQWLGGKSLAKVAVYYSENTFVWYGKEDYEDRYEANVYGMCRFLLEEHIPFDVIPDISADRLKQYDALILANTACMSTEECENVSEFVRSGKGLIATGRTALYNETGDFIGDFGLKDVIGDHYTGSDTAAYSRIYNKFLEGSNLAENLPSDRMIACRAVAPKIRTVTAEKQAELVYPYTEPSPEKYINTLANPPAVYTAIPVCTENVYGAGKAVYFAGQPEKDYVKYSFPEMRIILKNALKYVMNGEMQLEIPYEQPLEATVYEDQQGETVVHLVNHLNDYGRTMNNMSPWDLGLAKDTSPVNTRNVVQHIYPLCDVEVKVRTDREVSSVMLQPTGEALPFEVKDGVLTVTVPKIRYYEMLVIK